MGYKLMVSSFAGIRPAYVASLEGFTRLQEQGVTGSKVGPREIFEICGLWVEMRIDEAAGGSTFAKGVLFAGKKLTAEFPRPRPSGLTLSFKRLKYLSTICQRQFKVPGIQMKPKSSATALAAYYPLCFF